ncbi:putative late blight resistance protein R1A-10 [Salvia divinorum]|uniref:Late blight resistance protein R1A-10 n=1 Tax=Salvia divinorum TaxID=28513 RepID=A0ABD1HM10_SALDI
MKELRIARALTLYKKALLRVVRENVYKAEDAIDCFKLKEPKSYWRAITVPSTSIADIDQRITDVAKSVGNIRQKIEERQGTENEGFPGYESCAIPPLATTLISQP